MKISTVINNYNYAEYVHQAIESVLNQDDFETYAKELIIVDDGSTDNSLDVIRQFSNRNKVKIIEKENRGQLSTFHAAQPYCTGDIICYLDADDVYEPDYFSKIIDFYTNHPDCDTLCVRRKFFGKENHIEVSRFTGSLGFSLFRTYFMHHWPEKTSTSAFSLRKEIVDKILPYPFEHDWKICADNCLVFGSSLAGAKRYYLNLPLVGYRIHDKNRFANSNRSEKYKWDRRLSDYRLFEYMLKKHGIRFECALFEVEFTSIPNKDKKIYKEYFRIILKINASCYIKFKMLSFLVKDYFRNT